MGTRSDIIVHMSDGTWKRIYCHWDGYLSHNGRILFDHYTAQKQAEQLVALGDLSSLGKYVGYRSSLKAPKGHSFDTRKKGYCVYYGRDRWEQNTLGSVGDSLAAVWPEQDTWTEFTYVWDEGKWWCGDPDEGSQTLLNLGELLLGQRMLKPAIKAFGMVLGHHSGQVDLSNEPD